MWEKIPKDKTCILLFKQGTIVMRKKKDNHIYLPFPNDTQVKHQKAMPMIKYQVDREGWRWSFYPVTEPLAYVLL